MTILLSALLMNQLPASELRQVAYDNRSSMRGFETGVALVESLGLFSWLSGSTEVDDDETCFATTNGRWLLKVPDVEYVEAQESVGGFTGTIAYAPNSISLIQPNTSVATTVTGINVANKRVIVVPVGPIPSSIAVQPSIDSSGVLTISVIATGISGVFLTHTQWKIYIF